MKQNSHARPALGLAALACALTFGSAVTATAQPTDAAYALANRLGAALERCWFMGGDPVFGDYVYSPEPNATGGPRILVVPRASREGRPVLVIEILGGGAKPRVNVYGPLAAGPAADRIGRDLRRWLDGGDGCA
ncbi:MAG TPA: hypothetical protein VFK86_00290 [Bauldia sp.]|nr:hypothetical protein [Bauldia sp.]